MAHRELRHSSSSVYISSRLAGERGHTRWLGELKTTDSRFYIFRNVLTGDTNNGSGGSSSSSTAATLHKKNIILLKKREKRQL